MKLLLLATTLVLGVQAFYNNEWNLYKAKYKKVYTSHEEDARRLQQYLMTKKLIEEHNEKYERGETRYTMGINKFADWFPEEVDMFLGLEFSEGQPVKGKTFVPPVKVAPPDSINWVKKGAVTSVKDQKKCRSSYAFSAAGALEGLMFITNNTIMDLSAQELVDCTAPFANSGCRGGLAEFCYDFVSYVGGIDSDSSYPYVGRRMPCRSSKGQVVATCKHHANLLSEIQVETVLGLLSPVSVAFAAGKDFLHYESGIYDGTCANMTNQYMLAVGYDYDEELKEKYWLIKNSWGTQWGEEGYVRVIKGVNKCLLEENGSYPYIS